MIVLYLPWIQCYLSKLSLYTLSVILVNYLRTLFIRLCRFCLLLWSVFHSTQNLRITIYCIHATNSVDYRCITLDPVVDCYSNDCHAGVIERSSRNQQVLDRLPVERQRGITVKAQTATMFHQHQGATYMLNLIDTPVSVLEQY